MAPNDQSPNERPHLPRAEVGHHAPGLAYVNLYGEHDLSTIPVVALALEQVIVHSNVLVDLSECAFVDSTVIALLVRAARIVQARDEQLVLVVPAEQRQVARIIEMTHLREIFPVHQSRDVALASLKQVVNPR